MIVVTQGLKDTLKKHPHIKKVHFNSKGQYYFGAHAHVDEQGKPAIFSRYRKENFRESTANEDEPVKERITAKPEDMITETVSASDILSRPVDKDLTSDEAKRVSDENTSLRKQIEEHKASASENENLKKELEDLKAEKELADQIAAEEKEKAEKETKSK